MRPHLTSAIVFATVLALSVAAWAFTRSVREDNEYRLLAAEADQIAQVVQSLGAQQQGLVVSAALIANHTAGDPAAFRSIVAGVSDPGGSGGVWAMLTRDKGRVAAAATVGGEASSLAVFADPGEQVDARIADAFDGKFVVVGIFGEGMIRRLALAAGAPGAGSAYVAYYEIPLLQAASAGAGTGGAGGIGGDIHIALYVGETPTAAGLVLATGTPTGAQVMRTVNIGGAPISYLVWARHPLSGGLTAELPWVSFSFLLVSGWLVGCVVEMNLRRRDSALLLVEELDAALDQRDVADQQRSALENELRQAQRLEAVGQLAGGVAHDFNNILAAIMSYADLVADDVADHASRADVDEIRKAARRGARLTSQLLQFGNHTPDAGGSVDVNQVIGELHGLLSRAVGEEIDLRTDLAPDLPAASFGAAELEQLLTNLVVNAADAIDGAGTIAITTELVEGLGRGASATGCPPAVRVMVSDDGAGMDASVMARIFEPFFTTKERGRGTGLGLASVYGIVTRAGGTIEVRSKPGEGSVFDVVLKGTSLAPVQAPDTPPPPVRAEATGQRILLVEDEDALRIPTRRMLERAGYVVIEAADGPQAVAQFSRTPIDLLLTDVIMPGGMNGKQLAEILVGHKGDLPVLFMSGYSANLLARRGIGGDGNVNRLQKPFSEDGLLTSVATALQAVPAVTR